MNLATRRAVLAAWACLTLLGATAQAQPAPPPAAAADEFRVTLLGTGSPAPVMRRF